MAAALLLLGGPALLAKPAATPGIAVGQVLDDSLGKKVNGWEHSQGSMYSTSTTSNEVTTTKLECCIAVLYKANSYIVARTEPLARNATGGVIREKVAALIRLDARPGEQQEECGLFSLELALSLKNAKTGMVRSVVVDQGGLGVLEWKDSEGRCGMGD